MNGTRTHLELPASVRAQLGAVSRRLWLAETSVALLGALAGLLAAYVILFASDRLWDTPTWLRLTLALSGVICGACFAAVWVNRWVWHRRDARQLATLVQREYAKLGDRLLGIVELADDERRPANVSPELCRAAMEQVAAESAEMDFQKAVPTRQPRWFALGVALLGGAVAVGIFWMPPAALNSLWRLVNPVSLIERYTLTRFGETPAKRVVPYGEPFDVEFRLAADSKWLPAQARARFEEQRPVEAAVGGDGIFHMELPGQTKNGTLWLEAGDARRAMMITPVYRPELVELQANIQWPDYLGYAASTQDVRSGKIRVLEGTELAVSGRLNRAMQKIDGASFAGEKFWIEPRKLTASEKWSVDWEDVYGLRGREPFVLDVKSEMDSAPTVDCRGLERTVAILEDEVIEFEVVGHDDYGVKQTDVKWMAAGNEDAGAAPKQGGFAVAAGGQRLREVVGKVRFSPQALNLGPQLVVIQATALDYFPGRKPSQSPAYKVFILDRIEHAKLVQQRFEKLQEKLEELARAEENLFDQNRELRKELDKAEAAARLAEQQRAEEKNVEQMEKLLNEATELMKEALRNPVIKEQVLREWAKLLEKLQKLAKQSLPNVAKPLGQAQEAKGEPREQKMDEALAAQQKALQEMMETLRDMNKEQEQLAAGNFVSRLQKAAQQQRSLAGDLTKLVPETIGLSADQLSPVLKTKVGLLEDRESRNQKSVKNIRDDLGGFYSRTREKRYGDIHEEMVNKHAVEELEKLTQQIQANVGGQAIEQATLWAGQLEKWAADLAPPNDGGGGGGGGGGGQQMSPEMMELMLKLMRARLVEEGLRDNTRFVDEHKSEGAEYTKSASRLENTQRVLEEDVGKLQQPGMPQKLLKLLGQVQDAMTDAADMLGKPQTDGDTIAAQTEVIELLSQASQQAGGGGQGSGASASLMEMMQQMMGMGKGTGKSPGGNPNGGDSDRPNANPGGNPNGKPGEGRDVEKASGHDASQFPAEFRDALEGYFNSVEGIKK